MNRQEARALALSMVLDEISDNFLSADACYRDGQYSDADVARIERAFLQIDDTLQSKLNRVDAAIAKAAP